MFTHAITSLIAGRALVGCDSGTVLRQRIRDVPPRGFGIDPNVRRWSDTGIIVERTERQSDLVWTIAEEGHERGSALATKGPHLSWR